jgi:hypothetical protein
VYRVLWLYALIFKVRICMVTPELSDHLATWISDNKATGVSLITLQLRGSISDKKRALLRYYCNKLVMHYKRNR